MQPDLKYWEALSPNYAIHIKAILKDKLVHLSQFIISISDLSSLGNTFFLAHRKQKLKCSSYVIHKPLSPHGRCLRFEVVNSSLMFSVTEVMGKPTYDACRNWTYRIYNPQCTCLLNAPSAYLFISSSYCPQKKRKSNTHSNKVQFMKI